ncbi:oligosaccharide flippase family protein [Lysobacter sp. KIS68-7]|uniref:lipopolysaccharide biosynthesis protein n=1 Tax=Lysobacter sp. KIS68-7 TaxID=2904252 RepID=UPI001E33EBBC|nr:oligosaccharide flippase family protein [Lysobacter sp. KIS68-7]UHQ19918.1 oligosaccharide flippase family protein [Lysobacter sp. KIS68-7]
MISAARLRDNVAANVAGMAIAAVAAVLSAPLIYRWLGPDAYGLVGVYVLLQTLMPLFDAGITAGLARAVAWHRERSLGEVRTLVQTAQRPVVVLATAFFAITCACAGFAASHWLGHAAIPVASVRITLWLMAGALAVRMVAGLWRATLMALELQVRANAIQAFAAVARTFGALVFAAATGTGVVGFFAIQVPVSLVEGVFYRRALSSVLSASASPIPQNELAAHMRFALGIAGLSAAWLATSQIEKALLADRLSLSGYGAYSLGVHVASVTLLAVGTVHGAVLPRMTRQVAAGEQGPLRDLYGVATALTVAMSCGVVVAIAIGGRTLVPSLRVAVDGIDPLQVAWLYGFGNMAVALLALAYQLQNARGVLRFHAWGTALQALVQVPLMAWASARGDVVRTAWAFALVNWLFVVGWIPIAHERFLPNGHMPWLLKQLLPSLIAGAIVGWGSVHLAHAIPDGPTWGLFATALGAGASFLAAVTANPSARAVIREWKDAHAIG